MDRPVRVAETLRESDERFRELAESIDVVFWMTTPDRSELLYVSPAYERIWGRSCQELYATPLQWLDAVHSDDRPRVEEAVLAQRQGIPYDLEYRISRPDSQIRWIQDRAFMIRGDDGQVTRIVGMAEDITGRKSLQLELETLRNNLGQRVSEGTIELSSALATLATTEARQRAMLAAMPDRMYRLNRQGVFLDGHVPVGSFALVPLEQMIGMRLDELPVTASFRSEFGQNLDRAIETGEIQTMQFAHDLPSGRRHFEARLARSGVDEVVAIIRDVTPALAAQEEQRKLEEQLRQSQKLEAIGTLAGGIAHDFNNILTGILGHAGLLERKLADNPETRDSIQRIIRGGERARDLIRQMLVFSRPHDQSHERVRLQETFDEALKLLRAAIPTTVDIAADIDPNTPAVMADATQMHQVLFNLATNGLAALAESGGRLAVRYGPINLRDADMVRYPDLKPGPHVRLVVTDNGRGMEPEVRERVFEPFFTTRGDQGGSGLGLSVVHGIVRGHGGGVHVDSRPGGGSSFSVVLPVAPAAGPAPSGAETETAGPEACVMVVDDEDGVGELVELMLEPVGCAILRYISPTRALEAFRDAPQSVDLLLTDLTMPGLNGLELSRRMRELRPELPVIIMTGYSGTLTEEQTRAAGVQEWISKPFTADTLTDAVERTLSPLRGARPV